MAYEFMPATPADVNDIALLFREAFGTPADAPTMDPRFLAWKHTDPGPRWSGPTRSYILREGNVIAAHGAVWPVRLRTPRGEVEAFTLIDWIGRKGFPGAGVALVNKMAELTPVIISISGTKYTQFIMPRIGFPRRGWLPMYARVIRPWRQFQVRPGKKTWKSAFQLARNAMWSKDETIPVAGWKALETNEPVDFIETAFPDAVASLHDRNMVEWVRRCPTVATKAYRLVDHRGTRGHALVASSHGQARILDLRVAGENQDDWNRAFACVLEAVAEDPEICEAIACASLEPLLRALFANGFHRRYDRPLWVRDETNALDGNCQFLLSYLDADDAFLPTPDWPFAT